MFFSPDDIKALDRSKIPAHIAIIPDGNRRWAKKQEFSVDKGHKEGADVLMDTLRASKEIGVKAVTFYTFSTENWSRPSDEVNGLMWLIESYLTNERETMLKEGVRFHTIGYLEKLPESLQKTIHEVKQATEACDKIDLVLAVNYGARDEILRAMKNLVESAAQGKIVKEDITEEKISSCLDTRKWPDPDLLIRTSGEFRISNFLLWQLSYAEIFVTPTLWPDFSPADLLEAIQHYQKRERRRGGNYE